MGNMSYVRFENTYDDLLDCFDHLEDEDLSQSEQRSRMRLIDLCRRIAEAYPEEEEAEDDG